MRGLTFSDLDGEEYGLIMDYVDGTISKPAPQDVFLEKFCEAISYYYMFAVKNNGYGMYDPIVIYPEHKYIFDNKNYSGNYREIVDTKNYNKMTAYFDGPIIRSPLYIAINEINTIPLPQLYNALTKVSKNVFKSTKFSTDTYPLTVRIDLELTINNYFNPYDNKNTSTVILNTPGTLRYIKTNPVGDELLDVYDSSIMDLSDLNGIDIKKIVEDKKF